MNYPSPATLRNVSRLVKPLETLTGISKLLQSYKAKRERPFAISPSTSSQPVVYTTPAYGSQLDLGYIPGRTKYVEQWPFIGVGPFLYLRLIDRWFWDNAAFSFVSVTTSRVPQHEFQDISQGPNLTTVWGLSFVSKWCNVPIQSNVGCLSQELLS